FDDLVLHVRDIHHVGQDVALEFEVAPYEVGEDKGAEIADVREVVHGGSAAIHADPFAASIARHELLQRTRQGVDKSQTHAANGAVAYGDGRERKGQIPERSGHLTFVYSLSRTGLWSRLRVNC